MIITYLIFALCASAMVESKQRQVEALSQAEQDYKVLYLHEKWTFRQVGNETVYDAAVPGTVHQDLLALNIIPDPYYRDNLWTIQWVEKADYEYYTTFDVPSVLLSKQVLNLVFEGLDTHASVYLVKASGEKELLLESHNQFRQYSVDVKGKLAPANNQLIIHFQSAVKYDEEQAAKDLPLVIPISYPDDPQRMYSRKAAYQYGWDWGPRIVTCGIWKPVFLEAFDLGRLENVHVITSGELTDEAGVEVKVEIAFSEQSKGQQFMVEIGRQDSDQVLSSSVISEGGNQVVSLSYSIKNPKLWWVHNLGEPHLYHLAIKLAAKDGSQLDSKSSSFGVRTVELVQEEQDVGTSFYIKLNGRPVFLKGANYIPPDMLMPRVTTQVYENTLQDALDANYNAIRIWGGGNYEADIFYELCDQKGILLWQDFMFANTMFPGTEEFFANVEEEIVQNVKRIRSHPSVFLWCGNNEIYEGWLNWGWQKGLTDQQKEDVYSWYYHIFNEIIPEVLGKEDQSRPYWSTSPLYGWGHLKSLAEGDSHYWGVFAGLLDIEYYNTHFGKFNTEFGMQGMPSMNSVKKFSLPEDWSLESSVMLTHERHPSQYGNIMHYVELYYKPATSFEYTTYVAQVMQSYAMKTAFESHRRNKPRSMGTLMWQLNDVWPVTSWSGVDFYGTWKAVHYQSKRLFGDVFISAFQDDDNQLGIYVVSEKNFDLTGDLSIRVLSFDGEVLYEKILSCLSILDNDSKKVFSLSPDQDLNGVDLNSAVVHLSFQTKDDQPLLENTQYFVRPLNLGLKKPSISLEIDSGSRSISLSASTLAKDVYLYYEDFDLKLSDNFFDLIPTVPKKVFLLNTDLDMNQVKEKLRIISLYDSYQSEQLNIK